MRILLADDDVVHLTQLEQGLKEAGHEVISTGDGQGARTRLLLDGLDVVVIDFYLSQLDGVAVVREMRARGDRTPVVLATAAAGEDLKPVAEEAASLSPFVILHKPFTLPELLAVIGQVIA